MRGAAGSSALLGGVCSCKCRMSTSARTPSGLIAVGVPVRVRQRRELRGRRRGEGGRRNRRGVGGGPMPLVPLPNREWGRAVNGEIGREPQLRLLGDLCRSLAALGVGVQMRDALPGLTVNPEPGAPSGVGVYVFVSASGRDFIWRSAGNRHPVSDIDNAARRIADYVRQDQRSAGSEPGRDS